MTTNEIQKSKMCTTVAKKTTATAFRLLFTIARIAIVAFAALTMASQANAQSPSTSQTKVTTQGSKIVPTSEAANNDDPALPKRPVAPTSIEQNSELTSDRSEPVPKPSAMKSRISRGTSDVTAHLIFSPLDLFIPKKIGASVGWIESASRTWEFEYLRGKISAPSFLEDLGKMTDEKISIMARSYFSKNSFNLSYGLTYFRFKVQLGSEQLQGIPPGERSQFDVVELESFGVNVGVGNRWALTEHISFGVDWIELYQPLVETKANTDFVDETSDQDTKDDVEDLLDIVGHFPRFTVLKLQLGMTF